MLSNVILNLIRVIFGSLMSAIILDGKGIPNITAFKYQFITVTILTLILSLVPMSYFRRFKYFLVWIELEQRFGQAFDTVQTMNKIHNKNPIDGDLISGFFVLHSKLSGSQMINILEDIWYDKLTFSWYIIPKLFLPYMFGVSFLFYAQIYWLNNNMMSLNWLYNGF